MKKLVLTTVMALFALTGFSQIKWDARVGMSMSNVTKMDESGMKVGYTLGAGLDYSFNDTWSLQSGLMFTSKGSNYSEKKYEVKTNVHYLEIPVLAAMKFGISENMKFVVNAGPYLGFGLGGKQTTEYDGKKQGGDVKVFKKYQGMNKAYLKRFDLGLQYGVGLEINEHYLVNLTGQYGFISPFSYDQYNWDNNKANNDPDYNGDKISPKNLSFYITVGYRF